MSLRRFLFGAVATLAASVAWSQNPEVVLESRLREAVQAAEASAPKPSPVNALIQSTGLKDVRLTAMPPAFTPTCKETNRTALAGRYVVTWDSSSEKPCRIYDLSFPTLLGVAKKFTVSQVPVEALKPADYLAWVDGRYDEVYSRMELQREKFDAARAIPASWVKGLKFKASADGLKATRAIAAGGLPTTFKASDLDIGTFKFSENDRRRLKAALDQAGALTGGSKKSLDMDFWQTLADNPESFLDKLHFDWSDARKVYDVVLEGEFLPIRGPVALVDYERPYKQAVEAVARNLVSSMMLKLVRLIPAPVVKNLVEIAVTDGFEFIELTYADRSAMLEQGLRAAMNHEIASPIGPQALELGLDILFGSRADVVSEYMMAVVQGRDVRWFDVDKLGRYARYREEKQLDVIMPRLNSDLVTKKQCEMERPWFAFGVCSKSGKKVALYSLRSERSVLFWKLGAPMVHRYDRPYEMLMLRSTSWLLSAGVRMYDLPYVSFLQDYLANQLKAFAKTGLLDEAHLRATLLLQKKRAPLPVENEKILGWLYLQNINPFLAKSQAADDRHIAETGAKLGLTEDALNLSTQP